MKKVISMLVCITLLVSLFVMPVSAEQPISVFVNGEKLEFDVAPVLLNDRTMVPMRKIFETLDAFSGKIKMEGCKAELTISPKK